MKLNYLKYLIEKLNIKCLVVEENNKINDIHFKSYSIAINRKERKTSTMYNAFDLDHPDDVFVTKDMSADEKKYFDRHRDKFKLVVELKEGKVFEYA